MFVSFRPLIVATGATYTSGTLVASLAMNAVVLESPLKLNPDPIQLSAGAWRAIARVAGSIVYKYDQVWCAAEKKMPSRDHFTIAGFSSNALEIASTLPPAAGTTAMTLFV